MKTWANRQFFTYATLFVLLSIRVLVADPVSNLAQVFGISVPLFWVEILRTIQNLTYYLHFGWSFILVGLIIIINRYDLQSLNIDQAFVAIFIAGSLTYWQYYRWPSGWIALLIPVVIFLLHKKQEFKFPQTEPILGRIAILIVLVFFLGLMFKRGFLSINNILSLTHLIATEVPFVIVEEVVFRGLLWMFLVHLNWSAPRIVGLQAFLFWLSHIYNILTDPIFFWILAPIISIILGLIVWRSKSITISLLAHIFFNFLLRLG